MLDKIVNNFGLLSDKQAASIKERVIDRLRDDKDSLDTFKELTNTFDEIIKSLPNITIPSTIVGKSKYEGFKEIVRLYRNQNMHKLLLLTCTMTNLIARHSGATELSKVAAFMQNCLALYSIGDNLCNHISFDWDYIDTMYILTNSCLEGNLPISMQQYRKICEQYNKENTNTLKITNSSMLALVSMAVEREASTWFSAEDQKEHQITPLRTNMKGAIRHWVHSDDNKNSDKYDLQYEFTEYAVINKMTSNAVFELQFDSVKLYIMQAVSTVTNDDAGNVTVYRPSSREIKYFWIPNDGVTLSSQEVTVIRENIQQYINMLFVNNIDTKKFKFSFNIDGDLSEVVRQKAIPDHYVSHSIPKIINAIKTLHAKQLSRCYALVGQPGTGKSIGAQQISNAFPDVCTFEINKEIVENEVMMNSMMKYIKAVKQCIIILDDMDRSNLSEKNDAVCAYIKFFDKLNAAAKNDHVSFVFIATINNPKQIDKVIMCRSGRIDEMIEFDYPDMEALQYLFNYNDHLVNPDNPTDFAREEFIPEMENAIANNITAADISNIFADMAIYGHNQSTFTPEDVRNAIDRIKKRNDSVGAM